MDLLGTFYYFVLGGAITFGILNSMLEDPDTSKVITALILIPLYVYLQMKAKKEADEVEEYERERRQERREKSAVSMSKISESSPKDDWDELLFDWILKVENLMHAVPTGSGGDYVVNGLSKLRMSMKKRLLAMGGEWADRVQ